jgi:hypothetical protein
MRRRAVSAQTVGQALQERFRGWIVWVVGVDRRFQLPPYVTATAAVAQLGRGAWQIKQSPVNLASGFLDVFEVNVNVKAGDRRDGFPAASARIVPQRVRAEIDATSRPVFATRPFLSLLPIAGKKLVRGARLAWIW